jgi:hypothetical protein
LRLTHGKQESTFFEKRSKIFSLLGRVGGPTRRRKNQKPLVLFKKELLSFTLYESELAPAGTTDLCRTVAMDNKHLVPGLASFLEAPPPHGTAVPQSLQRE